MRTCKVCVSQERHAIEQDLLSGVSYRIISQKFDISQDAIGRQKRSGHIETRVVQAAKETDLAIAVDYWEKLELLEQKCEGYLSLVEQNKLSGSVPQYVRELRETLKLILSVMHAKKEQEQQEDSPFKIITSAPWQSLMRILRDIYPDAEKKVLEVYRREYDAEHPFEPAKANQNVEEILKDEFELREKAEREGMHIVDVPGNRMMIQRVNKPKFAGTGDLQIEADEDVIDPAPQEPDQDKEQAAGPAGQADEQDEWEKIIFKKDEENE